MPCIIFCSRMDRSSSLTHPARPVPSAVQSSHEGTWWTQTSCSDRRRCALSSEMKIRSRPIRQVVTCCSAILSLSTSGTSQTAGPYHVYVTNEKSGDVTVINGADHKVVATIPLGKRPRGIQVSPDGKTIYVAVSGRPISPPPKLDAHGKPISDKHGDDEAEAKKSDKAADGIAVVDVALGKWMRKINVGSDPEQLALSADGTRLYVSNEDAETASVLNIASGTVEHTIPVTGEPEGVTTSPDGTLFYVTCEDQGDVFVIDTRSYSVVAQFRVGGRPRTVAFLPDGSRAFITSESWGQVHVVNAVNHKLLKTIKLPAKSRPMCVVVSPDGKKAYVSTGRGGTVCVIDANTHDVLTTIKVGERPWGIAISPNGRLLYAANGPSDDVSVVDLATEREIAKIPSGGSPWGVVIVAKRR
ncbi:MAG: hypothetical protein EXS18_00355 [Verrucomicrobiae bacterium]|nr:hypothetical protein [Verrucomicrobiae bacterium]